MQKIKPLFALPLQLEFPPPYLGSGTASSARLLSQPNQRRAQHFPACCCSPVSYICLIKSSGLFINKPPEITAPIWQQLSRTFSTLSRRAWANQSCYLPKSWFRQKKNLQGIHPLLDFLCNIQSQWLKQSCGPWKFRMALYWVSAVCVFYFLVQNVLPWQTGPYFLPLGEVSQLFLPQSALVYLIRKEIKALDSTGIFLFKD